MSKTWNSINPATLSGAIDVIVVEQEDGISHLFYQCQINANDILGSLACSPFHVRFGKFSLLRPSEKKVEFKVNECKQNYAMKLGEGGEAFFVFETSDEIPEDLQTSPVISPATSPLTLSSSPTTPPVSLQEPEFLDLNTDDGRSRRVSAGALHHRPKFSGMVRAQSDCGTLVPPEAGKTQEPIAPTDVAWPKSKIPETLNMKRSASDDLLPMLNQDSRRINSARSPTQDTDSQEMPPSLPGLATSGLTDRSISPPPTSATDAVNRAKSLSQKLSGSNIPTQVTESGDLMLDMTGYKSSEEEALRAEVVARKILAEELEGSYDIGALIGADEHGNLWIYSSEEAKEAAARKIGIRGLIPGESMNDAASDPGYQSDDGNLSPSLEPQLKHHHGAQLATTAGGLVDPAEKLSTFVSSSGDPNRNYAKTLRLTSDQLKALKLKPGANTMSFTVNRAICQAHMYYWRYDVPIVISDIDGTITKSDALGHVLNMIGRDWTHLGVAKLYTDIVANGYNIFYLTSRSVGQADTTRTYLNGVHQEGYRLPKGPVILSPDRTVAALRREIYLRKPEVFKMACLRDILNLFSKNRNPFYAGFGNRLTDALSYRSVNIPSTRIFTINSNAEVSLDLLTLHTYKSSYVTMREVVDHFFPPVGLLVTGGGEEFTDFNYWREAPPEVEDSSDALSDSDESRKSSRRSIRSEDEGRDGLNDDEDEDAEDEMTESIVSQGSRRGSDDLVDYVLENIEESDLIPESANVEESNDLTPEAVIDRNLVAPTKKRT